jgi:hypothetical protein
MFTHMVNKIFRERRVKDRGTLKFGLVVKEIMS